MQRIRSDIVHDFRVKIKEKVLEAFDNSLKTIIHSEYEKVRENEIETKTMINTH